MGGEHASTSCPRRSPRGSSPRGRGTPLVQGDGVVSNRFIPAWAGNTPRGQGIPEVIAVHPRVGGEHSLPLTSRESSVGSSPRGRGTLCPTARLWPVPRFIPAWAGNTHFLFSRALRTPVHPRVGGEHGRCGSSSTGENGSSPRGRGTRFGDASTSVAPRFIPAWAGNTYLPAGPVPRPPVHPRVGGEHTHEADQADPQHGSSPRGRGTRPPLA